MYLCIRIDIFYNHVQEDQAIKVVCFYHQKCLIFYFHKMLFRDSWVCITIEYKQLLKKKEDILFSKELFIITSSF